MAVVETAFAGTGADDDGVETETEGSMGGNWGSGRPAALASAAAASWASMRW